MEIKHAEIFQFAGGIMTQILLITASMGGQGSDGIKIKLMFYLYLQL